MDRFGRARAALVAVTAIALVAAGGCALFDDDTDARDTAALADDVAAAIVAGDLTTVAWNGDPAAAQESWDAIVAGMGENRSVTASAATPVIDTDTDTATAALAVSWDLDGHEWSYETTVHLVKGEEAWGAEFDPSLVEASLTDGEVLDVSETDPARADVVGVDDTPLVTLRPVVRVGIDKARVGPAEAEASARALAALVEVDADGFATRVASAGDKAFVEAITLRDEDLSADALAALDDVPGARGIADELPLAPTRTFARPLLGTVGPATAEIIESSDGVIAEGDVVGLSGLQQRYDTTLRGTPGVVVRAVPTVDPAATDGDDGTESGDGESGRELFTAEPIDGTPLTITLDETAQVVAEEVLAEAGGTAALVAIRPSDGHVLAAAGTSPDGYAISTLGQYPPGSTFKTVTALALVRAGMTPDAAMSCPATITVDGYEFKNYDDYPSTALGEIDLRTALANSCNTAMIGARDTAGQQALADAAAALGIGVDQDLGFTVYLGSVPTTAEGTAHAAAMIGQGEVLASPLAMATAAASVVAGRTVVPVLVPGQGAEPTPPATPLTEDEAATLRDLMRATVTEGSATFLADVPGDPVIAKTGTAEFGTASPPDTHAWMIAGQGDLAVAVFVEVGDSGSATAGPLLEAFLRDVNR